MDVLVMAMLVIYLVIGGVMAIGVLISLFLKLLNRILV